MAFPATSRKDLVQASRRNELIVETGRQIQKDFGEFGLEIHFTGSAQLFYEELFEQMKDHVAYLISDKLDRFMHFLYRIDINENDIKLYESQMPNKEYDHVLTELIIHRELKKVITRDYFRQQANKDHEQGELEG
ncbi:hypothetical protein SAMN06265379_104165 [Saccharicrinis carchari]|uniref:Uncharacterized protein n=1 Tax=Saccharicrinis carchari TaxID=1168039 RepID=A0A521D394_SACCC|nr:hypothetical protein [Saccharicrinis carchari]SMO66165.1 hypothetical protein SAMN06265379_104165 [Saccharicrinis carchari]